MDSDKDKKRVTFSDPLDGKLDKSSAVKIVFVSLLMDLLAFTIILPLLPSLMDYYRKHDSPDGLYTRCLNLVKLFQEYFGAPDHYHSVLFGGFLGSLFSFLQFVTSPIGGAFSDVYGRRPVLLVSLIGIALSYLLWALSYDFRLFVLARMIGGLSKGNVSLIMAIMTDVSTVSTRASGMALVGIAFSLGFLIGPMIGACFAKWAQATNHTHWFHYPAIFALVLAIFDIIFVYLKFHETLPKEKRAKSVAKSVSQAFSYIDVTSLFKFSPVTNLSTQDREGLKGLGRVYFVYLFIYSGLEFTLTFLAHHSFNYTAQQQGYMFLFIGIVMAVIQGGWVRKIPPHKVKPAALMGLLLICPSFVFVGFAYNEIILYIGIFLFAVSTSMVVPCLMTLASQYGGEEQKGTVMGVTRSLGALARAIGPIFASIAYWSVGSCFTYCIGAVGLLWPWYKLRSSHCLSDTKTKKS